MIETINNIFDNLFNGHEIQIFTPDNNLITYLNAGEFVAKIFIITAIIYLGMLGIWIIYKILTLWSQTGY